MRSTLDKKTVFIILYAALGFSIITARLSYLQIMVSQHLWHKSQHNFVHTEKVISLRGDIVDSNGTLLATNRPVIALYWHGTGKRTLTQEQQKILSSLEKILGITFDNFKNNQITNAERRHQRIIISKNITVEQLGKITEAWAHEPNITIEKTAERFYPHGAVASHILGYLNSIDNESTGKMGLESIFNTTLKGSYGTLRTMKNSLGITLERQELLPAQSGERIQTTLDLPLQQIADKAFPQNLIGTLILMDPIEGNIKALISRPTFDPNIFTKPISLKSWNRLQKQQPFLNRAFGACYPPASLFKLVSLSAALETGVITPETTTTCKGTITFGRKYGCGRRYGGHGEVDITQTIAQSCNILFYQIGKRIDIDVLMDYARRFGLGEKTGVILHEKKGLMPTRAWKKATLFQPWWPGDTLQATIGQTYLLVTPIQIARMISSIFTGYLVTPRIVTSEQLTPTEPLRIKESTRALLQETMKAVITEGTGKDLHSLTKQGFSLYAKTGTGQTSNRAKRSLGGKHLEHAWSAVYFRYQNGPPLTLIVLIENVGGSKLARTCIRKFLTLLDQYHTKPVA